MRARIVVATGVAAATITGIVVWAEYKPDVGSRGSADNDSAAPPPSRDKTEAPPPAAARTPYVDEVQRLLQELPAPESVDMQLVRAQPRTMARIAELRRRLREESVQQSLDRLADVEMFSWPGFSRELPLLAAQPPVDPGYDAHQVDIILSNRRVLKLMQELGEMTEEQASVLVNAALRRALVRYEQLFTKEVQILPQPSSPRDFTAFALSLENESDGSPRLAGARYEVLSLVFLAGQLELKATRPLVVQVAEKARSQRDHCYNGLGGQCPVGYAMSALAMAGLYNRPVLAKGLTGTSRNPEAVAQQRTRWGEKVCERTTTHYDARLTIHDLPTNRVAPPDFSKGSTKIWYVGYLSDVDFDHILEWAGN